LERKEGKLHLTELARRILRRSPDDPVKGYRQAILNAPDISDLYQHYRGENLPDDETFLRNTAVETYHIPRADFPDFKNIFLDLLAKADLLQNHGDKTRILDVSEEVVHPGEKSARIKKLGSEVDIKAGDTCFVMQPFASPHGDYYEKIFKPAIEKTKLVPVRVDAEIFATEKSSTRYGGVSMPPKCCSPNSPLEIPMCFTSLALHMRFTSRSFLYLQTKRMSPLTFTIFALSITT